MKVPRSQEVFNSDGKSFVVDYLLDFNLDSCHAEAILNYGPIIIWHRYLFTYYGYLLYEIFPTLLGNPWNLEPGANLAWKLSSGLTSVFDF